MNKVIIDIPEKIYGKIQAHLLPARSKNEEACFLHVRPAVGNEASRFMFVDWDPIPPQDFAIRSGYHIELADEVRPRIIKHAHDLRTSVVEMHSHIGSWPATFSPSDMMGFTEFVPHVRWRLQGKPYFAIVVARGSFDGLAWLANTNNPQGIDGIAVGGSIVLPTGLSFRRCNSNGY